MRKEQVSPDMRPNLRCQGTSLDRQSYACLFQFVQIYTRLKRFGDGGTVPLKRLPSGASASAQHPSRVPAVTLPLVLVILVRFL
jgi:hypothetical protein